VYSVKINFKEMFLEGKTGFSWLGIGTGGAGFCKHGNEH
jgi:hypothetical protein